MEHTSLSMTTGEVEGGHLVEVSGEVDLASAPQLFETLVQWSEGDVHVDLSGVSYVDSSGLHALFRAERRANERGRRVIVHGTRPNVRRIMEIAGVTELLHLDGQPPEFR
jgi:anti-sigma B factor antagonist